MSIYRGPGGAGNATTDSELAALSVLQVTASNAATAAQAAQVGAAASALSASGHAANANASAMSALQALDAFDDRYLGSKLVAPSFNNDGDPLTAGVLYFNAVSNTMFVYGTSGWSALTSGSLTTQLLSGTGFQTTFNLTTTPLSLASVQVYINGIRQQTNTFTISLSSITFSTAPPSGTNNIEVVVIGSVPVETTDTVDVTFNPAGTGAVIRTAQAKLRESVSVMDFGALGDTTADDTAAQNAAATYVQSTYDPVAFSSASPANGSSTLFYQSGYYRTNGTIAISKKIAFKGDGPAEFSSGSRVVQFAPASDLFKVTSIAQGSSVSFQDMTLIGVGTGAGDLIHIEKGLADCNSQRYYGCVFGTPPRLALNIECGDDIIIDNCLFDVSATSAIALGTGAAANATSNVRIKTPAFFAVNLRCILPYNVDGLQILGAQVYPSGSGRTQWFIDGLNTVPFKLKDISIIGGTFKSVDCLVQASAVENLKIADTVCNSFGKGAGATLSGVELSGACSGVSITGNVFKGSFDTKNFYNDAAATVTGANITGNTFINTGGGSAPALVCANTSGVIANNTFIGFTTPSVSQTVTTTGGAISPGVIGSLAAFNFADTISGARQGDHVEFDIVDTAWPVPAGVEVQAFVSAPNTITISYRNVTGSAIGVPAHDLRYCVTRRV